MNKKTLTTIAQQHLDVATLETRGNDSLDFHSVSAWGVNSALTAAYLAGYAAALRAANGNHTDALTTERHTMLGGIWLGEGDASEWSLDQRAETVVTLPIPEIELLAYHWTERKACDLLIPTAIQQRRIA